MSDVEYVGEDTLESIGALEDITIRRALINTEKKRKEHIEVLSFDLGDAADEDGNAQTRYCDVTVRVTDGPNADYEYKERVYCDNRIKKGSKQSSFKSQFIPWVIGLAVAVKGKTAGSQYFQGCVRSQETIVEDFVSRAMSLCGQRATCELGIEPGGAIKDANGKAIEGKFYADKQKILGWVPAN